MIIELSSRMQMEKRNSDSYSLIENRQELILETEDGFLFNSREGHSFGPYSNIEEATVARQWFIYSLTGLEEDKPQVNQVESKTLFSVEKVDLVTLNKTRYLV